MGEGNGKNWKYKTVRHMEDGTGACLVGNENLERSLTSHIMFVSFRGSTDQVFAISFPECCRSQIEMDHSIGEWLNGLNDEAELTPSQLPQHCWTVILGEIDSSIISAQVAGNEMGAGAVHWY